MYSFEEIYFATDYKTAFFCVRISIIGLSISQRICNFAEKTNMDLLTFLEESLADGKTNVTFNGLDCEWLDGQWIFIPRNFPYTLGE